MAHRRLAQAEGNVIMPATRSLIAILTPMRAELRPLTRLLPLRPSGSGDASLWRCALGQAEIVAATAGIGTAAAARMAERILDAGPVDHLLVVGIAGGIGPGVAIGDLVVPEVVIDLASGAEYHPGAFGPRGPRGLLATSDELITDSARIGALARRGVVAIDMETAAIAAVCQRRGCPWSAFRAISDMAGDGLLDPSVSRLAGPDGEPRLGAALKLVLTRPGRILPLVRLARGASLAARVAASEAAHALRETFGAPGTPA
jgi:adenosylhomocysteine nucleosidase